VNVRFPFRLAAAAGLCLSSLGLAQQPIQQTNAPPMAEGGPAYGPPGYVGAPGAIDPVPLNGGGPVGLGMNPPSMPPYAWPTYAPYNNYSRVAYPTAYPYEQFPFIGPMYPFPRVPLGWRSVSLTWEDGHWWYHRTPTGHDWWRIRYH